MATINKPPSPPAPAAAKAAAAPAAKAAPRSLGLPSKYDGLVNAGAISKATLQDCIDKRGDRDGTIEQLLIDEHQITPAQIGQSLALYYGVPYEPYSKARFHTDKLHGALKRDFLSEQGWIPLEETFDGLLVLCIDPEKVRSTNVVQHMFPREVKFKYVTSSLSEFNQTLDLIFGLGDGDENFDDIMANMSRPMLEEGEEEDIELATSLRDILHKTIEQLERSRFQVAMKLQYVDEFNDRARWNNLDSNATHIIEEHLSELPIPEVINEMARRFDLMMLKLQIATLMMSGTKKKHEEALIDIAEGLSQKYTIPAVLRAKPLIESIKKQDFYKGISQKKLDSVREELRELVQYLESSSRAIIYTNLIDSDITVTFNVL